MVRIICEVLPADDEKLLLQIHLRESQAEQTFLGQAGLPVPGLLEVQQLLLPGELGD
jgi:hypothetical protein